MCTKVYQNHFGHHGGMEEWFPEGSYLTYSPKWDREISVVHVEPDCQFIGNDDIVLYGNEAKIICSLTIVRNFEHKMSLDFERKVISVVSCNFFLGIHEFWNILTPSIHFSRQNMGLINILLA